MTEHSPKKIGLLIIATHKYVQFVQNLLEGADTHFMAGHEVEYLVFTDQKPDLTSQRRVRVFPAVHAPWPMVNLRRYGTILAQMAELKKFDFLYSCDADMSFIGTVGDEILSRLVAVQHPGFYNRRGTPETRPESRAYVSEDTQMQYFCGGFIGGECGEFIRMAEVIEDRVLADLNDGIIAVWHEESHSNRYFVDNPPTLILNPGYCWVRNYHLPFPGKLEALDKNHAEMRN